MDVADFINPQIKPLRDTDTIGDAVREALTGSVRDLPVVDGARRFVGMLRIEDMLSKLLPAGALIGIGMDLGFVHLDLASLQEKLRAVEAHPVRDLVVRAEHLLRPDTSALEAILLLQRGARSLPVVDAGGMLVGVIGPRDVFRTLHTARNG